MAAPIPPAPTASSSSAPPTTSNLPGRGFKGRNAHNQAIYGSPLPIILPSTSSPSPTSGLTADSILSFIRAWAPAALVPLAYTPRTCIGTFDPLTRSVWVTQPEDVEFLFTKGFFGKGTLSRSEPTWRSRRVDMVKGGQTAVAEQIRAKRREERKKFKLDRAAAMLDAAKAAEAVLTASRAEAIGMDAEEEDDDEAEINGRASPTTSHMSLATTATTAATAGIDTSTLTPQTFLVRPTRPDANRNRGKKAFKRRPPSAAAQGQGQGQGQGTGQGAGQSSGTTDAAGTAAVQQPTVDTTSATAATAVAATAEEDDGASDEDFSGIEDMEHLQLAPEEAWFLAVALGVLKVVDPATDTFIPPSALLPYFLHPLPTPTVPHPHPSASTSLFPDDPFLVSYVGYHHFRSLGWVVKPGIKFCCDFLLYRRGPAFSHSAFAIVLVPVYADADAAEPLPGSGREVDKTLAPHAETDWYGERKSWKWLNTVMRVNSLVQKEYAFARFWLTKQTVIMVYITIPSLNSFPASHKLPDGSLRPYKNDMRSLLERYTVREVGLTRFGPARRRD